MNYQPVYTAKEAADVLKISPEGVYVLLDQRILPYFRILEHIRIRGSDLEAFIENRRVTVNKTIKIALTGGPSGGKTTFLNYMKEHQPIEKEGITVIYVPEEATIMQERDNILPFQNTPIYDFQILLFARQREAEKAAAAEAEAFDGIRVILCDRGIPDGEAYVGRELFDTVYDRYDTCKEEVLESYDAVIYFETTAAGDHYHKETNAFRRENKEEALALDRKTRAVWEEHPNLVLITNETGRTMEDRIDQAIEAIKARIEAAKNA